MKLLERSLSWVAKISGQFFLRSSQQRGGMTGEFLFRIFLPHVLTDYTKRFSQVKANISVAESFWSESSQPSDFLVTKSINFRMKEWMIKYKYGADESWPDLILIDRLGRRAQTWIRVSKDLHNLYQLTQSHRWIFLLPAGHSWPWCLATDLIDLLERQRGNGGDEREISTSVCSSTHSIFCLEIDSFDKF